MTSNTPAPQEPTLAQKQAQLAENLAKVDRAQFRRRAKAAPPQPSKAVTLEDHILEVSDDLLRVSAGFQSVLTLLDLQAGDIPDSIGLHALISPLKRQIDRCADRSAGACLTTDRPAQCGPDSKTARAGLAPFWLWPGGCAAS